jgi:hypothetical protein
MDVEEPDAQVDVAPDVFSVDWSAPIEWSSMNVIPSSIE